MADLEHYRRVQDGLKELLRSLASTWPKADVDYVQDEIDSGEYGEALENLLALSVSNNRQLDTRQAQIVDTLAGMMGIDARADRSRRPHPAR